MNNRTPFEYIFKTMDFLRECMIHKGKVLFIDDYFYNNIPYKPNCLIRSVLLIIFAHFLNQSAAVPAHMKYVASGDYIEAAQDAAITVTGDTSYFVINVSGLETGGCLKLATTNWGNKHSNGCLGVTIGGEDASSCMQSASSACSASSAKSSDTTNYPMKNTTASSLCGNNSTVKIWFKSCR